MTAIIHFCEMLIALLLAAILLATTTLKVSEAALLFSGGAVAWSLGEYSVHRFVLHNFAPKQHRIHHARPHQAIVRIFWQIWVCFAVVYLIAGGVFLSGTLVVYAWYLFVHHCAHDSPETLPKSLLQHHNSHHQFARRNYGVSTTLWDHLFKTMIR